MRGYEDMNERTNALGWIELDIRWHRKHHCLSRTGLEVYRFLGRFALFTAFAVSMQCPLSSSLSLTIFD